MAARYAPVGSEEDRGGLTEKTNAKHFKKHERMEDQTCARKYDCGSTHTHEACMSACQEGGMPPAMHAHGLQSRRWIAVAGHERPACHAGSSGCSREPCNIAPSPVCAWVDGPDYAHITHPIKNVERDVEEDGEASRPHLHFWA